MIGWGALLFAAGSGYYFARKDLNERKREQMKQGLRGPPMDCESIRLFLSQNELIAFNLFHW